MRRKGEGRVLEEERKRKGHNQKLGKQTKERHSADKNAQGTTK